MSVAVDLLHHPDGRYLPLDDAIRLIAPSFKRVTFDRIRGDTLVREKYDQLITFNAPDVILQGHLSQLGTTAWASIADEPDRWVEFVLTSYQDVFVRYRSLADRERLRPTVAKLAELLGYQVIAREEPESESDNT